MSNATSSSFQQDDNFEIANITIVAGTEFFTEYLGLLLDRQGNPCKIVDVPTPHSSPSLKEARQNDQGRKNFIDSILASTKSDLNQSAELSEQPVKIFKSSNVDEKNIESKRKVPRTELTTATISFESSTEPNAQSLKNMQISSNALETQRNSDKSFNAPEQSSPVGQQLPSIPFKQIIEKDMEIPNEDGEEIDVVGVDVSSARCSYSYMLSKKQTLITGETVPGRQTMTERCSPIASKTKISSTPRFIGVHNNYPRFNFARVDKNISTAKITITDGKELFTKVLEFKVNKKGHPTRIVSVAPKISEAYSNEKKQICQSLKNFSIDAILGLNQNDSSQSAKNSKRPVEVIDLTSEEKDMEPTRKKFTK